MAIIPLPQGMPAFNADQVEPRKSFDPIPAGMYTVKIINSEIKPAKSSTPQDPASYLELELEILDPEFAGRKLWDRLNLVNSNPLAVQIGFQTLGEICQATGMKVIQDTTQLHGLPMRAKVKLRAAGVGNDGKQHDASNEVQRYEPLEKATAAAVAPGAAPWAPATAPATPPAGWQPPAATPAPWEAKPTPAPAPPVQLTPAVSVPIVQPSPFPKEAIEWAIANPAHPQAAEILKTLPPPSSPAPAAAPWAKPTGNSTPAPKAPWAK